MTHRLTFVVVALAVTVAGCSGSESAAPPSSSMSRASTSEVPSRSTTEATESTEMPTTTEESDVVPDLIGFTSPSGNVGCMIDATYARCDVLERDWEPPPRPAECEFDYGQGVGMSAGEKPAFVCAGDTALGGGEPLAYGSSVNAGPFTCDSTEAGITCRDSGTGHGFSLAREAYRLF